MNHRQELEDVEKTVKDLLCTALSSGRVVTLCIADYRQMLPVVQAANRSQIVSACSQDSRLLYYSSAS